MVLREVRILRIEIRKDSVEISGYVNVALRDSRRLPSADRGVFVEQIEPQVFQRALDRNDDVKLLFNHSENRQLGSQKQGNLTLHEDAIGLYAKATVNDQEVINKARSGELRGWSFGFIKRKDDWQTDVDPQRRYIKDMDLLEVSILSVTPAYTAMSLETRGEETVVIEQRFEAFEKIETIEEKSIVEEVREDISEPISYDIFEKQIQILKLRGGQ